MVSDLPEVRVRGSMSVFRHRELNQIQHHYYFSVYLKEWLPYDFDPRPIKRALEVWLSSLDEGSGTASTPSTGMTTFIWSSRFSTN